MRTLVADIHPDHTASQAIARGLGLRCTDTVIDGEQRWQRGQETTAPPSLE